MPAETFVVTVGHACDNHVVLFTEHVGCYDISIPVDELFRHYLDIYRDITSHTELTDERWMIWLNDGGLVEGRTRDIYSKPQALPDDLTERT